MSAVLILGDSRERLSEINPETIDALVCDPPYEYGFLNKAWDRTGIAFSSDFWRQCYAVMKPGAHLIAFGATRTHHRIWCAIEDAGFEIRDTLQWMFGSGFPKSTNVGRDMDMLLCAQPGRHYDKTLPKGDRAEPGDHLCPEHEAGDKWRGYGSAAKPAYEPILLARKPLAGTVAANVLEHGTGGINVDGCRVAGQSTRRNNTAEMGYHGGNTADAYTTGSDTGRWPPNVLLTHAPDCGAECVDGCPVAELDRQSGESQSPTGLITQGGDHFSVGSMKKTRGAKFQGHADSGGASRFFPTFRYVAKASRGEREAGTDGLPEKTGAEAVDRAEGSAGVANPRAGAGRTASGVRNHHPTVKPIDLMRWLVRLATPPGGIVLDPFMGSGTTGVAARLEGFRFVGIEMDPDYYAIARSRIEHFTTERVEDDSNAPPRPEREQRTLF